ncbi:MAG TPA: TonB family protein [Nitrospiraceae bacterium]
MKIAESDGFTSLVGILGSVICLWTIGAVAYAADLPSPPSSATKRWVQFDLDQEESAADIVAGKPVTLSMKLGGVTSGSAPVVAICESVHFHSQVLTLEPDTAPMVMKGTVTLEPIPPSRTSVPHKVSRIQVTFARSRQDKLERFMRRIVYVTLDPQESSNDSSDLPPVRPEVESRNEDLIVNEVQPDVEPVSITKMDEEDLLPLPQPGQGTAYWQQVSYLVSRSWSRHSRGIVQSPGGEAVKVRFKLYPNGRAQLIEIEKGSGIRAVDEAGIHAVVHAQPFLPFPPELGEDAVDVHVRMRTGLRSQRRDIQQVGSPASKPNAPASLPKK